jgi:hypothetical protein
VPQMDGTLGLVTGADIAAAKAAAEQITVKRKRIPRGSISATSILSAPTYRVPDLNSGSSSTERSTALLLA